MLNRTVGMSALPSKQVNISIGEIDVYPINVFQFQRIIGNLLATVVDVLQNNIDKELVFNFIKEIQDLNAKKNALVNELNQSLEGKEGIEVNDTQKIESLNKVKMDIYQSAVTTLLENLGHISGLMEKVTSLQLSLIAASLVERKNQNDPNAVAEMMDIILNEMSTDDVAILAGIVTPDTVIAASNVIEKFSATLKKTWEAWLKAKKTKPK